MKKSLLAIILTISALVGMAPIPAPADVEVILDDGMNKLDWRSGNAGFTLKLSTAGTGDAGKSATLTLLNCSHPCSIFFPSGKTTKQGGDTFEFMDACPDAATCKAKGAARIEKWDESYLSGIELKGIRIVATPEAGTRQITVVMKAATTDFEEIPPGTYSMWGILDGTFTALRPGTGNTVSSACGFPANSTNIWKPCAKEAVVVELTQSGVVTRIEVNGAGHKDLYTVSIPCTIEDDTDSPCGGGRYEGDGLFSGVSDIDGSVTCPAGPFCSISHTTTDTGQFQKPEETFQLYDSGITATSRRTEVEFGVADLASALAYELNTPRWVWYSAPKELYRAVPQNPKVSGSKVYVSFQLQQGRNMLAKNGVLLTSIGPDEGVASEDGDKTLPPSERVRNDRSYVSYIPKPTTGGSGMTWNDVDNLVLTYDVIVKTLSKDPRLDSRLGDLTFSDCEDASFYVQIALANPVKRLADDILKIRLGSTQKFTGGCREMQGTFSGKNLIERLAQLDEERIEAYGPLHSTICCLTLAQSRKTFGKQAVKSISVVVDRGSSKSARNYAVELKQATVSNVSATDFLKVVDPESYKTITPPKSGRSMIVGKQTGAPMAPLFTLVDRDISNNEISLEASFDPKLLAGPGNYTVDLCIFGGRCLPVRAPFKFP